MSVPKFPKLLFVSYSCRYCSKCFASGRALGGHMHSYCSKFHSQFCSSSSSSLSPDDKDATSSYRLRNSWKTSNQFLSRAPYVHSTFVVCYRPHSRRCCTLPHHALQGPWNIGAHREATSRRRLRKHKFGEAVQEVPM